MSTSTLSPAATPAPVRRSRRVRAGALLVALLSALGLVAALADAGAANAAGRSCKVSAGAFGTRIAVGSLIRSGPTDRVNACTDKGGVNKFNRTVGVNLPQIASVGVVTARIHTKHAHRGRPWRVTAQTHTARVVLLGQLRARAIMARATASTRRHRKLVGVTTLLDVRLQGKKLPQHPKRNQKMSLPGLGTLTLDRVHRARHGRRISITVTALKLVLGANNPLGQPGIVIVIGHTHASVLLPKHHH